jgi:heterodisulfide reductase subunit A-like polyferredoxin
MVNKEQKEKAMNDMMHVEAELWDLINNEITNIKIEPMVVAACVLKVAVALYKDQIGVDYTRAILELAADNIEETWSPGDMINPKGQTFH